MANVVSNGHMTDDERSNS